MRYRRIVLALALALLATPYGGASGLETTPQASIRGFSAEAAEAQRAIERRFRAMPKPENLREYLLATASEPHHAGGPGSRKVAEYILSKYKSWGLDAWIEEHEALMPFPVERVVELVAPERLALTLVEPALPADPDSADAGQLPSFNAYSADGDVTAELVYVNYGTPEDYEQLDKLGIDVKGKIVIARYGRSWRGIKPKVASERGAVGCLIYSDPRDDGFFQGDVYPSGPWRPEQGVQRGSVMDMPVHPGDPLTPGWGSERGARKLDRGSAKTILTIPVLPISHADALPLLRHLGGPVAPEAWRGALPLTYHVGPGTAKVHMKLAFEWQTRPLYNVIARIPGAEFPDEWIIHGNHHDAWVNGASDPTSGNVALMETARGFAELLRTGWRPRRTLIFASWDGEEWGLLGSTEWAEKHRDDLAKNAIAYVNTDSTGKGWINAGGSHSLQAFVNEVLRDVDDPRGSGSSVLEARRARDAAQARTDKDRAAIAARREMPLSALGSGSDYTAFIDHLTVASLDLGFGGDGGGGVYHSIYDTVRWYTTFSDGDFTHGAALSRVVGTALLRLASADILPFEFGATERTLGEYVREIERLQEGSHGKVDLAPLRLSLSRLGAAADAYEKALARATTLEAKRRAEVNRVLYLSERAFRHEPGLPKREWFKHLAYAPGLYTGYGVKTLPGIREGIEQKQFDEARAFVTTVAAAIDRLAREVTRAAGMLR